MTYRCEQYLEPDQRMCTQTHCSVFSSSTQYKQFCLCKRSDGTVIPDCQVKGPTVPIPFQVCYNRRTKKEELSTPEHCMELHDEDKDWIYTNCYCCCSCFAWDTKIAISPEEVRMIQDFEVKDDVYAASIEVKSGKLQVTWQARPVVMSSGTGPNTNGQEMVVVQYGDDGEIIVTPDHLFLDPDGLLIRADRITANDRLVSQSGTSVDIHAVYLGLYTGGIHHISTEFEPGTPVGMNGHLLSSNGVISADFILQISQGTEEVAALLADPNEARPVLGTPEYTANSSFGSIFSSRRTEAARPIRTALFALHESITTPPGVPEWAPSFATKEQAEAFSKAPHVPITVERNKANFDYLKKVYAGFFPSIKIYLEWADETPNLYAFRQFGVDTVYVSGRILRTKCIDRDGLALILAHGIARLLAISVLDPKGYDCTGAADYDALSYVMPTAFYFDKVDLRLLALNQVMELFSFADMETGEDRCSTPTLECRVQAMQYALAGGPLPGCAGGVRPGELKLMGAEYKEVESAPSVVAQFNTAVMPSSAEDVTKYVITPETVVTTAIVAGDDPAKVVLTVRLPTPPGGDYMLEVHDILAADGSTLDKEHCTAKFHVNDGPKGRR